MFRPFSTIFGEVLDFLFEYIPEDGRERSKHVAGLPHVCMYIIVRRISGSIQGAALCARSTINTRHDEASLFSYKQDLTVCCWSKLPPQAANEIIIAHKLTVSQLVQYFVFFVQLDSTLSPPNLT